MQPANTLTHSTAGPIVNQSFSGMVQSFCLALRDTQAGTIHPSVRFTGLGQCRGGPQTTPFARKWEVVRGHGLMEPSCQTAARDGRR